jgi:hypothetical protein
VRTVAPAAGPVDLAQAKSHLRVDYAEEDALIQSLIDAATGHLDGWSGVLGCALITQTWALSFDGFADELRLPMPASAIVSVTYVDPAGSTSTIAPTDYVLAADALGSFVSPAYGVKWPTPRADQPRCVTVTFGAGTDAANVPAPIKSAILLMVGDLYANREGGVTGATIAVNPTVSALLSPFCRTGV